jgi:hypothetical protein
MHKTILRNNSMSYQIHSQNCFFHAQTLKIRKINIEIIEEKISPIINNLVIFTHIYIW